MALVCPVLTTPAHGSACVGHFISAEQLHLVSADDHSLVFQQLAPETSESAVRLPLAVDGRIAGLYRVPVPAETATPQPSANSAPDLLLIHTQVSSIQEGEADPDESEDEPVQTNKLHFKRYDAETQQLQNVSSLAYEDMDFSDATTKRTIAVSLAPGPTTGAVVFVNGDAKLCFVDPFDPRRAVCNTRDAGPSFLLRAKRVYWLTEDVVAAAGIEQGCQVLKFFRVERRENSADSSFKITDMGSAEVESHFEPPGIGTVRDATYGTLIVVLQIDDTLSSPVIQYYAFNENKVELVQEVDLDLPEKDRQVVGNCPHPVCYSRRTWTMLPSTSGNSFFVSDDAMVMRLKGIQSVTIFKVEGLPEHVGLFPLGLGVFNMYKGIAQAIKLVHLRDGKYEKVLKPELYEFDSAQLVAQKRDGFFGRCYWFSCESFRPDGLLTTQLFKTEPALGSSLSPIKGYPFVAPITGIWWVGEQQLLVFTATGGTSLYELNGLKLERKDSEFDSGVPTIAAAPGVQVTSDAVCFAGGVRVSVPPGVLRAAIDGEHVVVASAETVVVIQHGRIVREMTFDEVIVGVDCRGSVLAVCTVNELHVFTRPAYEQDETHAYGLRAVATSVACGPNGRVYVGDVDGDVYVWPEQQYVNVADNPVKSMRAQARGVTVLAGPSGSIYIDGDGRFMRLRIADASDVLLSEGEPRFGVAVQNGVLHFLNVGACATLEPRRLDCTEFMHGRLEDVKYYGEYVYSFGFSGEEWTLQRAPLENTRQIELFEMPFDDFPSYRVFMLSETKFLEVTKKRMSDEGPDEVSDDDEYESRLYEIHTLVRLCELEPELGKVRVLDEKRVHVGTDTLEGSDEILEWIKPFSESEFIVFATSKSAVAISVEPCTDPRTLKIGGDASTYRRLSSSYWMPQDNGEFILVHPLSGDIVDGSAQELRKFESTQDQGFKYPGKVVGRVTRNWRDTVQSAVTARGSVDGPYLVAAYTSSGESPSSRVSLVEVKHDRVVPVSSRLVQNRNTSLVSMCDNGEVTSSSKYAGALDPVAAVGTSRGGISALLRIRDEKMERALREVQAVLRETVEVVDDVAAEDDTNPIDGGLLQAALRKPEAEPVFAAAGLDAAELQRALWDLVL